VIITMKGGQEMEVTVNKEGIPFENEGQDMIL
jgi:hypothetical protein